MESLFIRNYFENVSDGHSGVREAVHEYGLEQTLGIVEHPCGACVVHHVVVSGLLVAVDERRTHVKDQVDDQRSGVLGQEHLNNNNNTYHDSIQI